MGVRGRGKQVPFGDDKQERQEQCGGSFAALRMGRVWLGRRYASPHVEMRGFGGMVFGVGVGWGQSVCPLAVTAGRFRESGLRVTVRNKGKVPVEGFRLPCAPAAGGTGGVARLGVGCVRRSGGSLIRGRRTGRRCRTRGLGRRVTGPLRSAEVAGGVVWTAGGEGECRALRVRR